MNRLESLIKRKETFINNIDTEINKEAKKQWSLDNDGVEIGDDFYMEGIYSKKRKCVLLNLSYDHGFGIKPCYMLYNPSERGLNKKTMWGFFGQQTIRRVGKCSEKIKELNEILEYNKRC